MIYTGPRCSFVIFHMVRVDNAARRSTVVPGLLSVCAGHTAYYHNVNCLVENSLIFQHVRRGFIKNDKVFLPFIVLWFDYKAGKTVIRNLKKKLIVSLF